jgi:hypothetical protein
MLGLGGWHCSSPEVDADVGDSESWLIFAQVAGGKLLDGRAADCSD